MNKRTLMLFCVGCLAVSLTAGAAEKKKVTTTKAAVPNSTEVAAEKRTTSAEPAPKRKALADEFSGQGYGMAGCGLGSIVFGDKPGMIQVVAATVNGTGYQTFAITSGTSNCAEGDAHRNASLFIEVNRQALKKDASRGNGETLANLSQIYGCKNAQGFGQSLQQNFEVIFNDDKASSEAVSNTILNTIKTDKKLAQSCGFVG
jgi:hypothetical protein